MFTREDLRDLEKRGISKEEIEKQLQSFRDGFPFLPVARPATTGDGILKPNQDTIADFINLYESKSTGQKVLKFVPASGAASRMFKDLYAFIEDGGGKGANKAVETFIAGLPRFAFYDELMSICRMRNNSPKSLKTPDDYLEIIKCLLDEQGLNYGNKPKGLIAFHKYGKKCRTPFEEHLVEGALYCRGSNEIAHIHMTVSPGHREGFMKLFNEFGEDYEKQYGLHYSVEFSVQKPSTDTIAVDPDNKPFRDNDGQLVFRPGGHGALLDNLADLEADITFIKNIDNVVPDSIKEETVRYKKALGGMLVSFRERINDYLNILTNDSTRDLKGLADEIMTFLEDELCLVPPWGHDQWNTEEKRNYLISKLDRPLRICGMVKNVGEPGGGPFWVKNDDGSVSLQIVESSQINLSNPLMKKLFNASTHFNPVDIVCSTKNFKGNKFALHRYRDPNTGFISRKSMGGRELKALELPGLWNGAMANWNTVFVEVPLSTFNPVKTVNDLLRSEHSG